MLPFTLSSTNFNTHIDTCFSNMSNLNVWFYESCYSHHKPICMAWRKWNT